MTAAEETPRRFARLVEEASGNVVSPSHLPALLDAGLLRARARGLPDLAAYVDALEQGALVDEWRHLLPLVTVKESFFFRTPEHFRAVREVVVPALTARRSDSRTLRIWSAGCARGEEPATLAIVLAEMGELLGWDWRILATDVDEEALAAARCGRYRERAVAPVPEPLRRRYFRPRDDGFELDAAILSRIDYRALNLAREPWLLPEPPYDLIFIRNVLIYFRPESQRRLARGMARVLAADGFLFLGACETLWQLTDQLAPVDLGDCFCYRHPQRQPDRRRRTPAAAPPAQASTPPPPHPRPGAEPAPAGPPPSWPSRAEEALAAAVRALAAGEVAAAREAVRAALATAPTDAAAHTLEGLVNEAAGDGPAALAAYRAALFLDPHLFQVRLFLAECLRRHGAEERAQAEYRIVLRTIDSGRGRALPFADALSLPDTAAVRGRAAAALRSTPLSPR